MHCPVNHINLIDFCYGNEILNFIGLLLSFQKSTIMKSNLTLGPITTFKKSRSLLRESKLKTSSRKLLLFSRLTQLSSNVKGTLMQI